MDWSAIGGIATSIGVARDIAKGLSAIHDEALIKERTSALLDQLLKAQDGLLGHNAALLQLQADLAELQKENLKLKAAVDERAKYTLVKFAGGAVALRSKAPDDSVGPSEPGGGDAVHYVCQPCFAQGRAIALQPHKIWGNSNGLVCPACKAQFSDK